MAETRTQERITAVLGPTNTGKTHFAIERLVAHDSGMMGFPLRLLARENYDRVCKMKGANVTALITGEEQIVPPGARYFLCTAESMPVDKALSFVALDEVQLCADPERGHIFTDRLLHCRGLSETMFLGSDTMTGIIRALVPEAEIIRRPRFSTLTHTGYQKITRLPRRSAAVAFSANDVYALAELVRRHRGGTAVVLGALSPRTRNAQVAMYQAGEVDYLVATDAIGMGLNMDVTHVAFADLSKFDGRSRRKLKNHEIAQIAGRAGRHVTDGTFGTTASAPALDEAQVEAIEEHRFDPVKQIVWRNNELDFRSAETLIRSLERPAELEQLTRMRDAEDHLSLKALIRDETIAALATSPDRVQWLWEVCQIPDFRKLLSDNHLRLLAQIYKHLCGADGARNGRLPHDWVANHLSRLERQDGDIDALMARIAHVRTWTYIAHRENWLDDPRHWQERSRALEDKLSDALHDRLTQRFVDKRSASLLRSLQSGGPLTGAVRQNGEVIVEGEFVGKLNGFRFIEDSELQGEDAQAVQTAARRALGEEIQRRVQACSNDPDGMFDLAPDGYVAWRKSPVAKLVAGEDVLKPRIELLPAELLDGSQRDKVQQRVEKFLASHIESILGPLQACAALEAGGPARGIAFQVYEALGSLPRFKAEELITGLEKDDRRALHVAGIRLGPLHVFLPKLGKTHAVNLRALLWSLHQGRHLPAPVPSNGRTSMKPADSVPHVFYNMIGYPVVGPLAIRVEILDRVISRMHDSAEGSIVTMDNAWAEMLGCSLDDLKAVLRALGYQELPPEAAPVPAPEPAVDVALAAELSASAGVSLTGDTITTAVPTEMPAAHQVTEIASDPPAETPLPPSGPDELPNNEPAEVPASDPAPQPIQPPSPDTVPTPSSEAAADTSKAPPVRFRLTKPRLGGGGGRRQHAPRGERQHERQQGGNQRPEERQAHPAGPKKSRHHPGTGRPDHRPPGKSKGVPPNQEEREGIKRNQRKGGKHNDRARSERHTGYASDDRPLTHSPFEKLRILQQQQNGGGTGDGNA
jgi:ATP-dependent RNA helicase SUPV3L1/SUV3